MKRERYSIILPALVFALVAVGFILGLIFPDLQLSFYMIFVLSAGAVILVVDRSVRRRVVGALNDERIQGIAERASWLSFKISFSTIMVIAFVLMYAFPATDEARLVGVGAYCAIGVQALVYGIAFLVIRSRR